MKVSTETNDGEWGWNMISNSEKSGQADRDSLHSRHLLFRCPLTSQLLLLVFDFSLSPGYSPEATDSLSLHPHLYVLGVLDPQ